MRIIGYDAKTVTDKIKNNRVAKRSYEKSLKVRYIKLLEWRFKTEAASIEQKRLRVHKT